MSIKRIAKEVLKINPNLEGYFRYNIDRNTYYEGKIKNSERNGYGALYSRDGKLLWEGIWMNDEKIDDVGLPNEAQIEEEELNLESCQRLTFKLAIPKTNIDFNLTYSVPSNYMYNLRKIIDKVIKQTNYSDSKDISVTVDNTECDLSRDSIHKMLEIDNIVQYINHLDFECSSCRRFNRGWQCCGQFAPFIYMYHTLLYENEYETLYKDRYGQNGVEKPSQVYNMANVFYKMFTGYADDNFDYEEMRNNIADLYGTDVPNHVNNLRFWTRQYPDRQLCETNEDDLALENEKSYLILLTNGHGVGHYCYVYRHNDEVIICDSWSHESDARKPLIRIMEHDEFIKCVARINELFRDLSDPRQYYYDTTIDDDQMLYDSLLYNFILDSLFLVPYNPIDIKKGRQTFLYDNNDLYYVAFIDPQQVHAAFDMLEQSSPEPFNMYLDLGGGKKRKGRKKTHKKRKNNKKTHKKR